VERRGPIDKTVDYQSCDPRSIQLAGYFFSDSKLSDFDIRLPTLQFEFNLYERRQHYLRRRRR
jgi:hypothetical protein